jgi:hypothetical protein
MEIKKCSYLLITTSLITLNSVAYETVLASRHPTNTPSQTIKNTTQTESKRSTPEVIKSNTTAIESKKKSEKQASQSTQPSTTAATAVVNTDFHSWSGREKNLTPHHVESALQDPHITNQQQAAVVGAVADTVNSTTTWNPNSLSSINQHLASQGITNAFPQSSYPNGTVYSSSGITIKLIPVKGSNPLTYTTEVSFTKQQLLTDLSNPNSTLYKKYNSDLQTLNNSYNSNGQPILGFSATSPLSANTHLVQGPVGDCYFVSAVNGVLQTNPQAIQSMITPVKDHNNWYEVNFPGNQPNTILVKLTPAEVAASSKVEGGGVWLAVLSNAEAQCHAENDGSKPADKTAKKEGSLDMLHGGSEEQTFPLLNGQPYKTMQISNESQATLANGFQAMVTNKNQLGDHPSYYAINPPTGINTSGHALLIVGYDPTTTSFLVLNPWGSTGYYNPATMGFRNKAPTQDTSQWFHMQNGEFTISLSQLESSGFVGMTIPTSDMDNFKS